MKEIITVGKNQIETFGVSSHTVLGDNHYFHWCTFNEQRKPFRTCAGLVDAWNEKREFMVNASDVSESSCAYAMKRGQCDAIKKRELEVKLNRSVFFAEKAGTTMNPFKDGTTLGDERAVKKDAGYMRGWNMVGEAIGKAKKVVVETIAPKKAEPAPTYSDNNIADAINAEINK